MSKGDNSSSQHSAKSAKSMVYARSLGDGPHAGTSYDALLRQRQLHPSDYLLLHAGAGSLGLAAVKLANAFQMQDCDRDGFG